MRINEQIEHYSSINLLYISTLVIAIGLEGVVSLSIYILLLECPSYILSVIHTKRGSNFSTNMDPRVSAVHIQRFNVLSCILAFFRNSDCGEKKTIGHLQ